MNNVTLRKLNKEDKMIIFGWISDPALRKMTGTKEKPTIDSHNQWFMEKFHNESGYYRIIEYAEKPVGFMGTNTVDLHNNSYLYWNQGVSSQRNCKRSSEVIY